MGLLDSDGSLTHHSIFCLSPSHDPLLPLGVAHAQICFVQLLKAFLLKLNNAIRVPTARQITIRATERQSENSKLSSCDFLKLNLYASCFNTLQSPNTLDQSCSTIILRYKFGLDI